MDHLVYRIIPLKKTRDYILAGLGLEPPPCASAGHSFVPNAWSVAQRDKELASMIDRCKERFEKRVRCFGYTLDLAKQPNGVLSPLSQFAA